MNDPDDRSARQSHCAECGEQVGDEWVSFKEDPADPNTVVQCLGLVGTGPVAPPDRERKRTVRNLRHEDLGLVFHRRCAPRLELPESAQDGVARLLADILVKDYERTVERWAGIRELAAADGDLPRCRAHIASAEGRRVFTMGRTEWERLKAHERRLIEIDIERTPAAGVEEAASVIACLAAERSVHTERIEVWPYSATDDPTPSSVQDYLVIQNLTPRRIDVPKFAERASTRDSPMLRKYLREHVFIVKDRRDEGRREAKARALERMVFVTVKHGT